LEIAMVMVFTTVVIRFGLLSAVSAMTVAKVVPAIPLTLQLSHWSATASNMPLLGILMLALFGFYASRFRPAALRTPRTVGLSRCARHVSRNQLDARLQTGACGAKVRRRVIARLSSSNVLQES
jgi:hypothetical protein